MAQETNILLEVSNDNTTWTQLALLPAGAISYSQTGLTAGSHRYGRVRAIGNGTTTANSPYAYSNAITASANNITPTAPVWSVDNVNKTFILSHPDYPGTSEFHYRLHSGGYIQYTGPIPIGSDNLAANNWYGRVKAAPGRNVSPEVGTPAYTGGGLGSLAATYLARIEAAGGTFTQPQKDAIYVFGNNVETAIGVDDIFQLLLYGGGTPASAVIDFMNKTDATLVGNPTVDATGVVLNGVDQYVNTNVVMSGLTTAWNAGITRKIKNDLTGTQEARSGAYQSATGLFVAIALKAYGGGANSILSVGNVDVLGVEPDLRPYNQLFTLVRPGENSMVLYRNNQGQGTGPGTSVAQDLPTIPIYDGAQNNDNTPAALTNNTLQVFAIHKGLAGAQVSELHTAINTLFTALGR